MQTRGEYTKKYKKYTKILDRLVTLNACASRLTIASGLLSVEYIHRSSSEHSVECNISG